MPIEYQCDQCRNTLRVADESAGKMARCPKCGNIVRVPGAAPADAGSATPPQAAPPPPRPVQRGTPASPAYNDYAPGPAGQPGQAGAATPGEMNPYASSATVSQYPEYHGPPGGYPAPTLAAIRSKTYGPGLALIILGSLNLVLFAIFAAVAAFQLIENGRGEDWIPISVMGVIMLLKGVPMIYGGVQMTRLKNYGLAMTGAIVCLVPCFYCWMAELGFGIWAIVVLSDYHVRLAFRSSGRAQTGGDNPFG